MTRVAAVIVAALTLNPTWVLAQTAGASKASSDASDDDRAVEVRVLGDRPEARERVPGSRTLITSEELERAQPTDAGEMLRRVPGLQVRQDESAGLRFDVGLRGLDPTRARRTLVLEDGVPLESNPYAEPEVLFGPTIERARGIEIVKGSGSILYGPETVGGVINFLTLRPPVRSSAALEVDGGEHGFIKGIGRYGNAFAGGGYVVQALHKQGDGFHNDGFAADDAFGKIVFETSPRGEATLKLGIHDERAGSTEVGLTRSIYDSDPRRPTIAPHDEAHVRRIEASLLDEETLGEKTTLRTLIYAYETTQLWRRQDYDRALLPGIDYERVVGDVSTAGGFVAFRSTDNIVDRNYQVAGLEPKLEHRFETAGFSHTLDVGARLLVEHAVRDQRAGDFPTSDAGALLVDEAHRTLALSAFAQDRIAFRDDSIVTPGVRVEDAMYHRDLRRGIVGGQPTDGQSAGDSATDAVIPGLGMVVGPPRAHLFGGLYGGFAPPRVTTAIGATGQDQHLGAERSTNYELGARAAPFGFTRFEVTTFLSVFQNQIIPAAGAPGFLANAGQTEHLGVEATGRLRIGAALGWAVGVDVGGSYTFARATFSNGPYAGNLLPYAPLHTGGAVLDIMHPVGLGGEVAWTHVGREYADPFDTVAVDASGRIGVIPAYDIIDVNARYRHAASGLIGLVSVKSLTDVTYVASRRPDGAFTGSFRQVTAGLRWESR